MGEKTELTVMKVGDRIYRFGFDPKSPNGYLDVFEIVEIAKGGRSAKYKSVKNANATLGSGCYMMFYMIGTVYSSGQARYVVLAENDYWKARKLLAEHLSRRRAEHEKAISRLNDFENWLSGQNEDSLE